MKKFFIVGLFFISAVLANDYEEWLEQQSQEFNTYKKTIDDEFTDMLKKDWKSYETMFDANPYKVEKPKTLPKIQLEKKIPQKEIIESPKVKIKPIEKKKIETPVKKIVEIPIIKKKLLLKTSIDFYKQKMDFFHKKEFYFKFNKINKYHIGRSWERLNKYDYKDLIKQIKTYKSIYNLNDWALYQVVNQLGQKFYKEQNKVNIFTWFILTKMSYDTKVAYNKTEVFLLGNVKENLYQVSFFTIDSKRYYVLTPSGRLTSIGKIFTYAHNYPKANEKLSFNMSQKAIKIFSNIKQRELNFTFQKEDYSIKSSYSKDLIEFYKTFPQSQYELYFDSKKSPSLQNSLLESLRPKLQNKSELEAVNFLLRFTQKSFKYKTDKQQFSYEKVLFPEETLFYKYSDCEDRSIMFAYLVKNLLGLEVVAIKYKDHLSTAVKFSSKVSGSRFKYKNSVYTMSDPTYINANVGMVMPKYKNVNFKVIKLGQK